MKNAENLYRKYAHLIRGLKRTLTPRRFLHSCGVAELAGELCLKFGAHPQKGFLTGLLHDLAREQSTAELLARVRQRGRPLSLQERRYPLLLHGIVAADLAAQYWNIHDKEILQAIRDHITGRPGMRMLSRIIFLADFLEPSREFLPEAERQKILQKECDGMLLYVIRELMSYYLAKKLPVSTQTRLLYHETKERIKKAYEKKQNQ